VFAGLAGALHTLHLGLISPAMVGVVPSIEMVVWVAVGGRASLYGAIIGTVLVNVARDSISSAWPNAWLYLMGMVFILVVVATPRGLAGLVETVAVRLRRRSRSRLAPAGEPIGEALDDVEVASHG